MLKSSLRRCGILPRTASRGFVSTAAQPSSRGKPSSDRIAVVGMGVAGAAAGAFLARRGLDVTVFERTPQHRVNTIAAGAGLLLQPIGMATLASLSGRAISDVCQRGARIERLYGTGNTLWESTVMDMHYHPSVCGIGIHRSTLFHALHREVEAMTNVDVQFGVDIAQIKQDPQETEAELLDSSGHSLGSFRMVLVCGGARCHLRNPSLVRRHQQYPWGAFWSIVPDRGDLFPTTLRQWYRNASNMLGVLPTGYTANGTTPLTSLFWSCKVDSAAAFRERGLAAWKDEVHKMAPLALPLLEEVQTMEELVFASYFDVRMRSWNSGVVCFLGDSAHACSPQLGQGANLALVDAKVMDETVGQALSTSDRSKASFYSDMLNEYTKKRRSHLRVYQTLSSALTPLFQSDSRVLAALRDVFFPLGQVWPASVLTAQVLGGVKSGIFSTLPYDPALTERLRDVKNRGTYAQL